VSCGDFQRLGVAFMTNTPWVFSAFWSVIKPFLNEVTLAKVQFVNGKKDFGKILEARPLPPSPASRH
jgi:hypothetical protein